MNQKYSNEDTDALFENDKKGNEKAPDYTGEYTTPDNQKRRVAAWIRESKAGRQYLSLKFSDMQAKQKRKYDKETRRLKREFRK